MAASAAMKRAEIRGQATIEGTATAARRFGSARRLGRLELHVAPVAFGASRLQEASPLHRQALEEALRAGINLIDGSARGDGGGERLIGQVLAALIAQEVVRRQEIVVVSKVGYIEGPALEAITQGRAPRPPEVVEYQPTCWHCIHPDFLAQELAASRARLGLATLDVLLLHNPEYLLIDRHNRTGAVRADDHKRLRERLAAAFRFLEGEVARGTLGAYGISANGLAAAADAPDFLPLAELVEVAREVAGEHHHFAVVGLPLNLYETGALQRQQTTTAGRRSALEIAAQADLGVITQRPLSAFVHDAAGPRLLRLADVPSREGARPQDPAPLLRAVADLEEGWRQGLGQELAATLGDPRLVDLFRWGHELTAGLPTIRDLGHWMQLRNGVIATHMGQLGGALLGSLEGPALERFRGFWEAYGAALGAALDGIEDGFRARAQAVVDLVGDRLAPSLPPETHALPLSQRAVLTLLAAPITSVAVAMRRPRYVHEMRELAELLRRGSAGSEALTAAIDLPAVIEAFAPISPLH